MSRVNNMVEYRTNKDITNGLYVSVQNGEVTLKAPGYLSKEEIKRLIEEKKNWIINKLLETKKEGITTKIFGKEYKVNVLYKFTNMPILNIENMNIEIILPRAYKKIDNDKVIKLLLEKMYLKVAKDEVANIMEKYRVLLGIAPEDYEIKTMKSCLAKCSRDSLITINPNIVKYNKKVIEYTILHQICHLKYRTHSKGFYEMIKRNIPEYRLYERELQQIEY